MSEILEFGMKRENEERRDGGCTVVLDPVTQLLAVGKQDGNGHLRLFSGGIDPGEGEREGSLRELLEESGLDDYSHVEKIADVVAHFHNSLKNVNRVAHAVCFLVVLKSRHTVPTKLENHEKFSLVWVTRKELIANWTARNQNKDYDHWLYFLDKAVARAEELGYLSGTETRSI